VCGIVGFIDSSVQYPAQVLKRMTDAIVHRGPDDEGIWCDHDAGVSFGHRRLSILDLSPAGHQPMVSPSGRFVIVFNGEIYNHLEIRKELEKHFHSQAVSHNGKTTSCSWRGHADTETFLAAIEAWGIDAALKRFVGMFALALWDKAERTLTLARDRMGEKPLYYGWNGRGVFFSSELKALRVYPGFNPEINRNAITLLLRHNCIPAPYSIYRGIFKLWPGTILTLHKGAHSVCPWDFDDPPFETFQTTSVSLRPYWSLREVAEEGQAHLFAGTESGAVNELERVLAEAVQAQQISDVPLGAFLSGGVDSSTIVAFMQAHATRPVKTFTVGFHVDGYNEAGFAKEVARHLGTEHTELYVTPEEAMAVIPRLPALYDEPFSDSSQIPTFLVSQLARQHVTVSLSGDAGDELFGGYNRHLLVSAIWKRIGWIPHAGRQALANVITRMSPNRWDQLNSLISPVVPRKKRLALVGDKAHKLAEILTATTPEAIYINLVSHWKSPAEVVRGGREPLTSLANCINPANLSELEHRMMFLDAISYLPDDILVKVDRAAMGVSLETRVPFLDHRVVEFAWRLPLDLKIRNGQGKWILRQVLYKYVPRELIERPKSGFSVPIGSWLRGPLREWAESLLAETRLRNEGFFNPEPIVEKWREHISGKRNWQHHLWDVLMFQAWLAEERKYSIV
jgi:asparagine synthase (glutamine-hydrolysing)